jgi:hypothetical protein
MVSLQYMSIHPTFISMRNYKIMTALPQGDILLLSGFVSEQVTHSVTCLLVRVTCITLYSIVGKESAYSIYDGVSRKDLSLL